MALAPGSRAGWKPARKTGGLETRSIVAATAEIEVGLRRGFLGARETYIGCKVKAGPALRRVGGALYCDGHHHFIELRGLCLNLENRIAGARCSKRWACPLRPRL